MTAHTRSITTGLFLAFACFGGFSTPARAQQEKGDKEVRFFSSGFSIGTGELSGSVGFGVGGSLGYFVTRRHEVGAGTNFSINRFRFCTPTEFDDQGNPTAETCDSRTAVGLGLSGFYRYNFARAGARHFPFIGG